ncbi:DNL zinc finger-domain-containing protein [Mycena maculata]|uniref:DNL zinc finger-domain-containing protein n=1 Tax=Mycena maculata TaxID=230809 RepID=A0AAD7KA45_9AGAR|nr:DNL zinc finger-domain-containing protein [Mycena maculata]
MLPSRLFRNTGIPPILRSLVAPHPSLPATLAVQLRLRLGVRPNSLAASRRSAGYSTAAPGVSEPGPGAQSELATTSSQALPEAIAPKLSLTFTCTADGCAQRSTHQFSKQAYESGLVLVQCPGCKNRHLIADHLGWFKESTEEGKLRTIEDILRARGETVTRGTLGSDGVVEYVPPS